MISKTKIKRAVQVVGLLAFLCLSARAYLFVRWPSCGQYYGAISIAPDGGEKDAIGMMSRILKDHNPTLGDACAAFIWMPDFGEERQSVNITYSFARRELWFRSPKGEIKVARPTELKEIQMVAKRSGTFSDFSANR